MGSGFLIKTKSMKDIESSEVCFSSNDLPIDKRGREIYLYEWCQNDGDWVEKGQAVYLIHIGQRNGITIEVLDPFIATTSGVLQRLKAEGQLLGDNESVYSLHPKGMYQNENVIDNRPFSFYFNRYKYNIHDYNIRIIEWNKGDGEYVNKGEQVLVLGNTDKFHCHYAEKSGFIDKVRSLFRDSCYDLHRNELVYIIHENDEERIIRKFVNTPNISMDDFTNKKVIKWKKIANFGMYSEGITSKSLDGKVTLTISLNNIDEKDFIVFQFYRKEIMLSKDDTISFLFMDNKIIDFKINTNSYKSSHPRIEKLFENKVQITEEELDCFEKLQFLKWKIILKKQNVEIVGGNEGYEDYKTYSNLTTVIKKFTKEYRELVKAEIPNYIALTHRDTLTQLTGNTISEECFVYLMIDTNNHYHKIGISNKPEWREKTLQSEKPTIELLASKKFVSRKIASSIEKALHDTFADKRIRGEWFQLCDQDIAEIKATLTS